MIIFLFATLIGGISSLISFVVQLLEYSAYHFLNAFHNFYLRGVYECVCAKKLTYILWAGMIAQWVDICLVHGWTGFNPQHPTWFLEPARNTEWGANQVLLNVASQTKQNKADINKTSESLSSKFSLIGWIGCNQERWACYVTLVLLHLQGSAPMSSHQRPRLPLSLIII